MGFDVAISGDSMITDTILDCERRQFLELIDVFRTANVSCTHLESVVSDGHEEAYPGYKTAEVRLPTSESVVGDLMWAGFDIVSTPGNHTFDYSYGGLYSTWSALREAGLAHAGTGASLTDARSPAFVERGGVEVALISMTSTAYDWTIAGDTHADVQDRPGVNPLRYYHVVSPDALETLKSFATVSGWALAEVNGEEWLLKPPGKQYTVEKFVVDDSLEPGQTRTVVEADDAKANLQAIRDASDRADIVIVHVHSHEFGESDVTTPPAFLTTFAKRCVDTGADLFVSQGCHALRGIEIYEQVPIFYGLGSLLDAENGSVPRDLRVGLDSSANIYEPAITASGDDVSDSCIVPVCTFDSGMNVTNVEIHAVVQETCSTGEHQRPNVVRDESSKRIIDEVATLSKRFGTDVSYSDGRGVIPCD